MDGPLERKFGRYRIVFRKSEHLQGRPTPHVEVWTGSNKVGNYDMATGRPLPGHKAIPTKVAKFLEEYLKDSQVQRKVTAAIKESFFDLSKPAGEYGAIPKGFKATVFVDIPERNDARKR